MHSLPRPEQDDPRAEQANGDAEAVPPVRHAAFNGPVKVPGAWPWSSYRATCGDDIAPDWLSVDGLLQYFDSDRREAQNRYCVYVSPYGALKSMCVVAQSLSDRSSGDSRVNAGPDGFYPDCTAHGYLRCKT